MDNTIVGLEQPEPILSVECNEPDGKIVRHVRPCYLSFQKLQFLYEQLSSFDVLFNDYIRGDFTKFVRNFVAQDENGEAISTGLLYEVDDVGIVYITELRPLESALAHFVFWDRRFRGREELCRELLRFAFETFQFHRIRVEVPLYSQAAMKAVERLGLKKEGRAREAVMFKGKWFDVNLYSILDHEVSNGSEDRTG